MRSNQDRQFSDLIVFCIGGVDFFNSLLLRSVVALEQRVPAVAPSYFLSLSDETPIVLNFRGIDMMVAAVLGDHLMWEVAHLHSLYLATSPHRVIGSL